MEGDKYDRATKAAKELENAERDLLLATARAVVSISQRVAVDGWPVSERRDDVEKSITNYESAKAHFEEDGTVVDCPPGP